MTMATLTQIWAWVGALWADLKGYRTAIWSVLLGVLCALAGAAEIMDWAPVLRANFPSVPAWLLGLFASAITLWLRAITTTPVFKKDQ